MQVFVPYAKPLVVAKYLDPKRLNRQIQEAKVIINAIEGVGKGWFNHPVTKMYSEHRRWLRYYCKCLYLYKLGFEEDALTWSDIANALTPPFLTDEFCDQHKRRLYTKDKEFYKDFAEYGESDENWYVIDGEIVKYKNGKKL